MVSVSSIGRMATRSASGKILSFVFAAVAVAMVLESSTSVPGSKCLWNNIVSTLIWRVLNNREESLPAAVACQGGDTWRPRAGEAASESTIARAWSSVVAPRESRGADTAATIAPVRVSARRTWSQVTAGGAASPSGDASREAGGLLPPRPHPAIQPIRALRILRIQARQLHAPVRAVDELELAHVHPNVGHARPGTGRQKQDVTGAECVDHRRDLGARVRLIAAHARQANAVLAVGVLNQPRAVESVVGRAAPDVRRSQRFERRLHHFARVTGDRHGRQGRRQVRRGAVPTPPSSPWPPPQSKRHAERRAHAAARVVARIPEPSGP